MSQAIHPPAPYFPGIEFLPPMSVHHIDYNWNYAPRRVWQPGDPLAIEVEIGRKGGLKLDRIPDHIKWLNIQDKSVRVPRSRP